MTNINDIWNDEVMLKCVRDLCPDGKRVTGVQISVTGAGYSPPAVDLTVETRRKIDARLRELRAAKKGKR